MSHHDLLFCRHVARLTHSKKLPPLSRRRIESLVRSARIGVAYRPRPARPL